MYSRQEETMTNRWRKARRSSTFLFVSLVGVLLTAMTWVGVSGAAQARGPGTPAIDRQDAEPQYDGTGALQLPNAYRQWVFVGSSLGLSYSEGQQGMEMFHETLMEPTAYKHFVETGRFREGTMLALILHATGEKVLPARRGRFAADVHGVEMAVKDASHRSEGWAYYNFGGMNGLRTTSQAMPKESCFTCHAEHAKRDNVFLQFYPLLAEAAHLTAPATPRSQASEPGRPVAALTHNVVSAAATTTLALKGLDPVLLIDGREEMGKPEIVASHESYRYQFVSEPNRVRFAANPATFSIQNTTCLVVSSAPVDPSLFAVHEGRIYAFATSDCVDRFKARPAAFVKR
jgi:YHS domain-containing protein